MTMTLEPKQYRNWCSVQQQKSYQCQILKSVNTVFMNSLIINMYIQCTSESSTMVCTMRSIHSIYFPWLMFKKVLILITLYINNNFEDFTNNCTKCRTHLFSSMLFLGKCTQYKIHVLTNMTWSGGDNWLNCDDTSRQEEKSNKAFYVHLFKILDQKVH